MNIQAASFYSYNINRNVKEVYNYNLLTSYMHLLFNKAEVVLESMGKAKTNRMQVTGYWSWFRGPAFRQTTDNDNNEYIHTRS